MDSENAKAYLRPRARLMSTLGEELISNERVALAVHAATGAAKSFSTCPTRNNGPHYWLERRATGSFFACGGLVASAHLAEPRIERGRSANAAAP